MNEIIKTLMESKFIKHIASVLLSMALVVPYYISFLLYDWHEIKSSGFVTHIMTSIILAFMPICIWWVISRMTIEIMEIKSNPQSDGTFLFDESKKTWEFNMIVTSVVTITFSFLFLWIVWLFSLGFKWFFFLTYIYPIFRLIITCIQYINIKRKK